MSNFIIFKWVLKLAGIIIKVAFLDRIHCIPIFLTLKPLVKCTGSVSPNIDASLSSKGITISYGIKNRHA